MKWTKKKIAFNILQLIFYGVIPLVLIFLTYGSVGNGAAGLGFKIAAPGIILLILVFLCFKRLFINKRMSDAREQLNNLKADLKVKTDAAEVRNIETAIKNLGTVEVVLNSIVPILLTGLMIICCKVMEAGLVRLSGTCGFILISFVIGTVFAVLDAREVVSKHRESNDERTERKH